MGKGRPSVARDRFANAFCSTIGRTFYAMSTMTVSEARAALPQILDWVGRGDEVKLTRHGIPVAVIVRPDRLKTRRAHSGHSSQ